jgi:YidC/Oxa1 family membrane protein insertase
MDRNTTIGLVLIFAVLMVFSYINKPSKDQIEETKRRRDSIALVQQQITVDAAAIQQQQTQEIDTAKESGFDSEVLNDKLWNLYGDFAVSAIGEEEFYILENNLVKITLSSVGGKIHAVELKNYKRFDSTDLYLIEANKSVQNLSFFAQNRNIKTDELFFKSVNGSKNVKVTGPEVPTGREGRIKFNEDNPGESREMVLRLDAGNGRYVDYVYTISHNSYKVGYSIRMNGMNEIINTNTGYLSFNFNIEVPRQERASKYGEDRYTTIYYRFNEADIENLSLNKSDKETLNTPIKWIGYKQLFFSTVLMAETSFNNAIVESEKYEETGNYVAGFKSDIGLAFDPKGNNNYDMTFYFGPNHYQTLREHGQSMEKLINLGWPVVREVNRYLIIPVFNFLRRHIDNFGIIILILTILIRVIVFPFTYKSYVSQAKMRALKPEVDEINKKFTTSDKAMEKQQATMALYKKVGVNPMGGCLPMLFQFPILIAMFYFFPGSIELRQESFLWATDLSTYDSIFTLPFTVPFGYGDHVSLFTLLMTITTILQTRLQSQTQDTSAMPGMKYMMYFMPVIFMFVLNSYSSGLSYYYFLANIFTIGQTYLIRLTIDEVKVRAQLMANKKKVPKPKSGFQKRLEDLARQQEASRKLKK